MAWRASSVRQSLTGWGHRGCGLVSRVPASGMPVLPGTTQVSSASDAIALQPAFLVAWQHYLAVSDETRELFRAGDRIQGQGPGFSVFFHVR